MAIQVGRPFEAVNPERPFADFANGLRALKTACGLTFKQMSIPAVYSIAALASAAGGLVLPSLEVTLAFVRVCGGSAHEWRERWDTEHQRGGQRA
ncbi:hypothetical protein [Catelliglobosispora koreensis]|uniref:hypothetical protein n=1 Tax=Catelliglobosispora koreensis TaxID=129052 RepID=UPI00035F54AB|nr:hypothetical protein [Catelliglobosispora koreensis]